MMRGIERLRGAVCTVAVLAAAAGAQGQSGKQQHWVGSWATSPFASPLRASVSNVPVAVGAPAAGAAAAATPQGLAPATVESVPLYGSTTLRQIVHLSLGGPMVRVELSNEFGTSPLTIGEAHLALPVAGGQDGAIRSETDKPLTFSGAASVSIPAGAMVVSDPVAMDMPAFADLAVSLYVPEQPIAVMSAHGFADQTNYHLAGNAVATPVLTGATKAYSWALLKGVEVAARPEAAAVVAYGDSITDGAHATRDANARWPDVLAARLHAGKKTAELAVLNEGIGGNRVLHDGTGPNALARFDRDVLANPGVKYLIILEGINDIGRRGHQPQTEIVSSAELIGGMTQMVERAHAHGIKVFGATLTPYGGAGYSTPQGELDREAVNQWIRTGGVVDGVIDFDKATQDPEHPKMFLPKYDSGDHLHPSDAGYKAMGDAIDLALFK